MTKKQRLAAAEHCSAMASEWAIGDCAFVQGTNPRRGVLELARRASRLAAYEINSEYPHSMVMVWALAASMLMTGEIP